MQLRICLMLALSLAACAKPNARRPDAAPVAAGPALNETRTPATPAATAQCRDDGDCNARARCIAGVCNTLTASNESCGDVRVHFDFDSTELRPAERPHLLRLAQCVRSLADSHVTIEGHADERGTQEYNLALGDRRATAIARYLRDLGVSESQLRTVSFGKEQPLCREDDEACHERNRRAEFKLARISR